MEPDGNLGLVDVTYGNQCLRNVSKGIQCCLPSKSCKNWLKNLKNGVGNTALKLYSWRIPDSSPNIGHIGSISYLRLTISLYRWHPFPREMIMRLNFMRLKVTFFKRLKERSWDWKSFFRRSKFDLLKDFVDTTLIMRSKVANNAYSYFASLETTWVQEVEFQEVEFQEIKTGDWKFFDQEIKFFFHFLWDQKLQ